MAVKISAHRVFFPLAAIFAAVAVPVWGLNVLGIAAPAQGITVLWHGHEMVFGFALAVIAGFLLTKVSVATLLGLLGLWFVARASALFGDLPWLTLAALQTAYPVGLAVAAVRPFLRAAKAGRNLMFVPVLAGFTLAELIFQLGRADIIPGGGVPGIVLGADLIACLMFMMGGRLTAAATSGAVQDLGEKLMRPAQVRLERNGLLALAIMAGGQISGVPVLASVGAGAAAVVVGLRLIRWKIWKVARRPEISCLHLGFLWLGLGLLARAAAGFFDPALLLAALHGVTVGALGTFSLTIMTRTGKQRARVPVKLPKIVVTAIFLISFAAFARWAAYFADAPGQFIFLSVTTWSFAYVLFLGHMVLDTRRT